MQRFMVSTALVALFSRAIAGVADWAPKAEVISFVDGDWEDKCEGEQFPIKWSKGNGKNVVVKVKGNGWEEEICGGVAPGDTVWEVDVPKCDVEYSIWLKQEECEELESPKFYVNCAEGDEHGGWGDKPKPADDNKNGWGDKPTVVVVYDDEACKCQKTKTTVAPTPSQTVWYDAELKCSVTASTPVPAKPTGNGWDKPVAPASASGNGWDKPVAPASVSSVPAGNGWDKPVAPATGAPAAPTGAGGWASPAAPVAPASSAPVVDQWNKPGAAPSSPVAAYKGAGTKVGASAFGMVAVFGAALLL